MGVIYGNPITIGGGTKLNIDYGATAPTDTSKLWVPLSSKPSGVSVISYLDGQTGNIQQLYSIDDGNTWYAKVVGDEVWLATTTMYSSSDKPIIVKYNMQSGQATVLSGRSIYAYSSQGFAKVKGTVYSFLTRYYSGGYNTPKTVLCTVNENTAVPTDTSLNVNAIKTSIYASAATDGNLLYLFGGSGEDYITSMWVVDVDTLTVTKQVSLGNLYYASPAIVYNGYAYVAYNNTTTVAQANTYIMKIDLSTYEKTVVYTNTTDMKGNTRWSLTNDESTAFLSMPYASTVSGSTNYRSKTLKFNLDDEAIAFEEVSDQSPFTNNYTRAIQTAYKGNIYLCKTNTLYTIPYYRELQSGQLSIIADIKSGGVNILSDKKNAIYISPLSVYIGNSNNIAEQVDAYLYDAETSQWKSLSGESYVADMLNALNVLGVN